MRVVMPIIETERLRLVPMSLADAASMVNGYVPEGARWVSGYPTEGSLVAAGLIVTAHGKGRDPGPYTVYQIVTRRDGVVIGDCGFEAPPDEGRVHVLFGIAFGARLRGYALEALRGLLAWAREQPEVETVTAEVQDANIGMIAVLERAGMRRVGAAGRLFYYEI